MSDEPWAPCEGCSHPGICEIHGCSAEVVRHRRAHEPDKEAKLMPFERELLQAVRDARAHAESQRDDEAAIARLRRIEAAAEALSDAALDAAEDNDTPCRVPGETLRNLRKALYCDEWPSLEEDAE